MDGRSKPDREPAARRPAAAVVVSCEHGGRRVPDEYRPLFASTAAALALDSHRAHDEGAAVVARALARRLSAPLFIGETTRLLVDLNRSLGHPQLFSEFTRALPAAARAAIVEQHYRPYRVAVESAVAAAAAHGQVVHVSAHSFTPELAGQVRRADVGLLFDPRRAGEAAFAALWREALRATLPPASIVRRNYPYRGVADGFTTALRKRWPADRYLGLELEVNQRLVTRADWPLWVAAIVESLDAALRRQRRGAAAGYADASP